MDATFTELMSAMSPEEDGQFAVTVPDHWMQGRAIYGGLSTALTYAATQRAFPDLPPLRSAQISFVGPAGGPVTIRPDLLRQGRSVSFVNTDLHGEKGLATRAVFAFGHARPSLFDEHDLPAPADLPSATDAPVMIPAGMGPRFADQFQSQLARGGWPVTGSDATEHFIWIRHKDHAATNMAGLLAIADMPPPAIMPKFKEFAPISSMTWQINVLTDDPQTNAGWWLLRSSVENAKDGYSSQDMNVWNTDGEPILAMRQSVAIFL